LGVQAGIQVVSAVVIRSQSAPRIERDDAGFSVPILSPRRWGLDPQVAWPGHTNREVVRSGPAGWSIRNSRKPTVSDSRSGLLLPAHLHDLQHLAAAAKPSPPPGVSLGHG
jgi:hypothetical protein